MPAKKKLQRGKANRKKIVAEVQPEPEVKHLTGRGQVRSRSRSRSRSPTPPPQKKGRKPKTDYRIDDHAIEVNLVEWYRVHDELWCQKKSDFRNKARKDRMFEEKSREVGLSVAHIKGWYRSMRDQFIKFDGKSGDGKEEWMERQGWIIENFQYFKKYVKHRSRPIKSVKVIIMEKKGDLEAAEAAAALQGQEVNAEQPGTSQQESTLALKRSKKMVVESESESVAILDEKVKESSEILSFLKSQMPPPENVTERTTYAAYLKSVSSSTSLNETSRGCTPRLMTSSSPSWTRAVAITPAATSSPR